MTRSRAVIDTTDEVNFLKSSRSDAAGKVGSGKRGGAVQFPHLSF